MTTTRNLRIKKIKPLISPDLLREQLPSNEAIKQHVTHCRTAVSDIIHGKNSRLLAIVGPCSIHDTAASLDYAKKLKPLADKLADKLCILMRVYFEKPRTSIGWKGLINDPHLNGSFDINHGLSTARHLLLDINQLGLGVATEFLDTITPQYIADLVSWAAIGARTTESQVHRNLASGLSMPIGFKNATSGDVQIAVDAIHAANHPHHFLSVTEQGIAAIVSTEGNPDCHVILRGGNISGPNFDADSVKKAEQRLLTKQLNSHVMIDCSHGNSNKDYRQQKTVIAAICEQLKNPQHPIAGIMLESNLVAGNQALKDSDELIYGQSITDACVDFSETEQLLQQLADSIQ